MTKHVLITGGSDGIGKLTAKKLLEAGYKVTILSHDIDKTKAAAKEIGCQFVVADVAVGETGLSIS
jgi:NAD(P)-dependent dehydrogenase (short-subunit alcohol dehydrogenase family)